MFILNGTSILLRARTMKVFDKIFYFFFDIRTVKAFDLFDTNDEKILMGNLNDLTLELRKFLIGILICSKFERRQI